MTAFLTKRESGAFRALYLRYSTKVYAKCISMLKNETQAQDATQEIFTKVFLKLSTFGEKSKFSTWLYSITYNYCIDYIRRKRKEQKLFSEEADDAPDLIEEVDDKELLEMEVERLKVVLEKIPPGDKAILLMKYQDELSIKEIAETIQKTDSAVKMQIKRAKTKAQIVYKEHYKN
ncbi:MAG: sigma-70 family RNA polymerase sigma factor [Saprospiraceae bacterium]|nr:sigma-70 family RNA polymerase sigma factor [Saprospiraceae bacterium]